MSVRRAESDIRSAQSRVTQLSNQLASYEKQGLKSDAERTRGLLEQAKADLARANARLVSETQKETQAKADAAAEERHREEMELQREIAKENAEATREAAIIEAEAIRDAERKRELAQIDFERKTYVSKLSDEELLKLISAVRDEAYKDMLTEYASDIDKLSKITDEKLVEVRQKYNLVQEINRSKRKLSPSLNKTPVIIITIIGALIGFIFSSIMRSKIIESTPSLWSNSYTDGGVVHYEVSNVVSSGIFWLIFIIVVGTCFALSLLKAKKELRTEIEKIPEREKQVANLEKQLVKIDKKINKLDKDINGIEKNGKYDLNIAREVAYDVLWKAEYASQEYESRHYTDKSIDDIVSKAKK